MSKDICAIEIDDSDLPAPTPEIEQERKVAIFDLLEDNSFRPAGGTAATARRALHAAPCDPRPRLVFDVDTEGGEDAAEFHLSLSPFRQVVKDYWQICESYYEAVKTLPPSKIEAIDMARRGIHDEGARVLQERLDGKAEVDHDTARRLFTLVCVLHHGG